MPWGTTPTVAGSLRYAKGRVKRFAKSVEEGAKLHPGRDDANIEFDAVDDPKGFTATLKNDGKVLAYRRFNGHYRPQETRFVAIAPDGKVLNACCYSVGAAVQMALGGTTRYECGESKLSIHIDHKGGVNRLRLWFYGEVPNPNAEWEYERFTSFNTPIEGEDVVWAAVGFINHHAKDIVPFLDFVREYGELSPHVEERVGWVLAQSVPLQQLKRRETRSDGNGRPEQRHVNAATGVPVEGPNGEWHKW